jgi:hypothetical protein
VEVIILENQSLLDIAIQCRGNASAAFEIAKANGKSLTDELNAGKQQVIPDTLYYNKDTAEYYQGKELLPATSVNDDFMEGIYNPGIGEMIIELNFMPKAVN